MWHRMAANEKVKVICLGDSAVGKSKLVERYLKDNYKPQQLSTYALTLFKHTDIVDDKEVSLCHDNCQLMTSGLVKT